MSRDDFSRKTIEILAKRVGCRCSNPACQVLTSGPHSDEGKAVNVGVAAHISAASPGGARYDSNLTPVERGASSNGIWLCQRCAKLVDSDVTRYTRAALLTWKDAAEAKALAQIAGVVIDADRVLAPQQNPHQIFADVPQHLSEFSVVFLGAGFSRCATKGDSPLMATFFRGLDATKYWILESFLRKTCADPQRANVEVALAHLDQMCDSPIDDALHNELRKWHATVKKELNAYCLSRLNGFTWEADNWILQHLAGIGPTTTVITTNYDNIAERILSGRDDLRHFGRDTNCAHCKMLNLLSDSEKLGPKDLTGWQGAILKLHGSVAWKICRNGDCPAGNKLIADKHCRPLDDFTCTTCDADCEPGIVLPQMHKSYRDFPQLRYIWEAARVALCEAESIAIIGYSLPVTDSAVWQLLRTSILSKRKLKHVAVFDIAPERVADQLTMLLDEVTSDSNWPIGVSVYKIPEDGTRPTWSVQES